MACSSVGLTYVTTGAATPPNVRDAELVNPEPAMVTVVPPAVGPLLGPALLIASCELDWPLGLLFRLFPKVGIEHARMKRIGRK